VNSFARFCISFSIHTCNSEGQQQKQQQHEQTPASARRGFRIQQT
jgi:hypothetical protein